MIQAGVRSGARILQGCVNLTWSKLKLVLLWGTLATPARRAAEETAGLLKQQWHIRVCLHVSPIPPTPSIPASIVRASA